MNAKAGKIWRKTTNERRVLRFKNVTEFELPENTDYFAGTERLESVTLRRNGQRATGNGNGNGSVFDGPVRFFGRGGDNALEGSNMADLLHGARAMTAATAKGGRDTCISAEETRRCETTRRR